MNSFPFTHPIDAQPCAFYWTQEAKFKDSVIQKLRQDKLELVRSLEVSHAKSRLIDSYRSSNSDLKARLCELEADQKGLGLLRCLAMFGLVSLIALGFAVLHHFTLAS